MIVNRGLVKRFSVLFAMIFILSMFGSTASLANGDIDQETIDLINNTNEKIEQMVDDARARANDIVERLAQNVKELEEEGTAKADKKVEKLEVKALHDIEKIGHHLVKDTDYEVKKLFKELEARGYGYIIEQIKVYKDVKIAEIIVKGEVHEVVVKIDPLKVIGN